MKKEYIEALQWLFGEEIGIWCNEYGLDPKYTPKVCHLIDEALLKREDVEQIATYSAMCGHEFFIYGRDVTLAESGGKPDPLTARLEAITKLKQEQA